jgi:hypothetical protein
MAFDPLSIEPGDLRHSITIQAQNSAERDPAGQPIPGDWTTILTTMASIESTTSASYKQQFQNNALAAQSTDLITIRWPGTSVTVAPGQRVVFGNDTFLIQAVDNVLRRNRKLRLACLIIDSNSN